MNIFQIFLVKLLRKTNYSGVDGHAHTSFSQLGEDLILEKMFEGKKNGFYVDIGAYHPKQYSNTYIFYLKGWRGINIEPMPGSIEEFSKLRPRDINLEIAIGHKKNKMTYHIFNQKALNGFSKKLTADKQENTSYRVIETKKMNIYPLSYILKKFLPKNQKIDFMSIDVEGLDLEVLKSNDWNNYRPKIIIAEDINFVLDEPKKSKVFSFLTKKNYILKAKTNVSLIFESL